MENEEILIVEETTENTEAAQLTEVVEVEVDRLFLTTPLNEYTVSEGLLLMILLVLIGSKIAGWIKEGFYWLW